MGPGLTRWFPPLTFIKPALKYNSTGNAPAIKRHYLLDMEQISCSCPRSLLGLESLKEIEILLLPIKNARFEMHPILLLREKMVAMARKTFAQLHLVPQKEPCLVEQDAPRALTDAFAISHLDYCDLLLVATKITQKLSIVQQPTCFQSVLPYYTLAE